MDCSACGHANPDRAKFCLECGAAFSRRCAGCGTELPSGAHFCLECGARVDGAPGAQIAERSPRDYTPRHLAEKILRSKSALEGELKQVTVLFADVKGSMDLAAGLGPEPWHDVLDRFFKILSDGVHRFEGTVNQYLGDGIMALFGAPIAHEDHASRAGYASLHLRDVLREFAREIKRRHGVEFAVRIGLHSGEVVVGKIGDDLRMDYTAQGHTVGLAQRMEALASGGSIYLSEPTAALIRSYFEIEDLGDFEVKGANRPLRVFELRGTAGARTRFDVSRARGLSRFVGRSDETAMLETALELALGGPGRTVGVMAQAGTGKTRLCFEFVEACRARGLAVYEASGLSHGAQLPLVPMLELVRSFFGIDERDSDRVAREKVAGRTLLLDPSLHDELPIIFDLLGVPDPARPLPETDPDRLKRRLYAAVRAIVHADAELERSVLLIEDLHWLDPASDALLEQIIEANAGARGLVLVNFRPEYRARWMQQSHYQQISLLPLSEEALNELLADLLGSDSSVAGLSEAIHARTGGNPFFIEEMVQSLVEDGHLEGTRGAYRLVSPLGDLPVPESVQTLLAARIDRLPEREKRVLQAASLIAKTFREGILARVVDLPEDELREALRALQDAEFLYEEALYPEPEYSFKHPLTQATADLSQLSERRARTHARVARAVEELDADRLDERAALLAHHWEGAGENARAAHWHARAAGRIGTTDYGEAYAHWARIDALLEDAESDPESDALRTRVFHERLQRGFRVGLAPDEAEEIYARGRAFHASRGNDAELARLVNGYAGIMQSSAGRLVEYRRLNAQAMEIARRVGDPALLAMIGLDRVYALTRHGALEEAVDVADEMVALCGDDALFGAEVGYSPLITTLAFGAVALVQLGRAEEAGIWLERALQLMGDGDSPETTIWVTIMQAEIALEQGDLEAAWRFMRRGRTLAERSGSVFDAVASQCWVAIVLGERGDWDAAVREREAAASEAELHGGGGDVLTASSWLLPTAYLALGRVERARALADEAIADCARQEARATLARCYVARAAIRRADGASEADVDGDLDTALRLSQETGAYRIRALVLEQRGELREALRIYRAAGASGHAARIERELEARAG